MFDGIIFMLGLIGTIIMTVMRANEVIMVAWPWVAVPLVISLVILLVRHPEILIDGMLDAF